VHIKVEDTDGEGAGGGDGEEATGGEGHGEGKGEEKEEVEEEEEEEEEKEGEGQQHLQHGQAPGASFEGRTEAGADKVASPRRARPPPGSYADTIVDYDEEEEDEDEDEDVEWGEEDEEEEEWGGDEEEEEEAEPRDPHAHAPGASLKGGSEAVRLQRLTPGACTEPGSPRARLRAPGRLADNAIQDDNDGEEERNAPELVMRGGAG